MEELTFEPKPSTIFGVPYEKIHNQNKTVEYLYARNNFTPTLLNNQIYLQGYYSEILSFITSVEHGHSSALTDIATVKPTYEILMGIESFLKNPTEIHIEGNLQHNRYQWQEGKGANDVKQTLWEPNALIIPHNVRKSVALLLP